MEGEKREGTEDGVGAGFLDLIGSLKAAYGLHGLNSSLGVILKLTVQKLTTARASRGGGINELKRWITKYELYDVRRNRVSSRANYFFFSPPPPPLKQNLRID